MSTPWVPPYFGSYEQLVNALLHDPFLGSGHRLHASPKLLETTIESTSGREGPVPDPWRNAAVSYLMSALNMREIASHANGKLQEQLKQNADAAISQFIDDFCGTPPRRIPWHWPGPPPWNAALASELALVANTLQEGALRSGVLALAGRIMEKGLGQSVAAVTR